MTVIDVKLNSCKGSEGIQSQVLACCDSQICYPNGDRVKQAINTVCEANILTACIFSKEDLIIVIRGRTLGVFVDYL